MRRLILLFSMFLATLTCCIGYADNKIKANEQVSLEVLLLEDQLILNFVSHPEFLDHFRESQKKRQELAFLCKDKINQLKQAFPNNYQVALFEKRTELAFSQFEKPLPYEEVFAPLLVYGLGDTSSITDSDTLKEVQAIQVKIFKNWLARFHIGFEDPNLLKEIRAYAIRSPLDIFSKLIAPFLEMLENQGRDFDDIIDFYTYDDHDEKSDPYSEENTTHFEMDEDSLKEIVHAYGASLKETLDATQFDEVTDFDEDSPVGQAIEATAEEIESLSTEIDENYFYFNVIVDLFLKINNR